MTEVYQGLVEPTSSITGPSKSSTTNFSPMKALRSLSIGSQLSSSSESDLTYSLARRRNTLQKGRPAATTTTVYEELNRNPSKSSRTSTTPSASGSQTTSLHGDLVSVVHHGPLQHESSMLKTKKEYLVLTSTTLAKFKNRATASDSYPQVSASASNGVDSPLSPVDSVRSFRDLPVNHENHVPLDKVVSVFKDESGRPSFGIEVWWRGQNSAFSSLELEFNLPDERDEWLKQIQQAVKLRNKASPDDEVPGDIESSLKQLLEAKQKHPGGGPVDIYPVVPRRPYARLRSNTGETKKGWRDGSCFYLAIGKNSCLLAQFSKSPTGQRVNPNLLQFGIVTISRVNASHQDERFDLIYRLPLDVPCKLQLSSRHHRTIITKLFRADSFLKPSWPHWTRREVFLLDGDSHHIQLTEGEDFGGFKRALDAFLIGYHCQPVDWTVQWRNVRYAPEFRLLPPKGFSKYTAHQLLAVFRALRYNDYFKSLSFCDVDFSSLAGALDNKSRLESTTWLSRTGKRSLTRVEFELVENASVLFQEIVALLVGSESLRHIDLSNVLSNQSASDVAAHDLRVPAVRECEIVAPIVLMWKSLQTRCNSVNLSGNRLAVSDVAGLSRILQSRPNYLRSLNCSRCQLDGNGLALLWEGLHEQRHSVEAIDLSDNLGTIEASTISPTLDEAKRLRRLNLAHVLKGDVHGTLFRPWKPTAAGSEPWRLEEMDLSGWKMNFDTLAAISKIVECDEGRTLRRLVLNNCGLTGEMVTALFCQIGGDRDLELSVSENPLELGSVDWVDLIHGNEAPKRLHLNMIHFRDESKFQQLLVALTHNKSIESLSLVGTGPQALTSPKTTELLSAFFENNTTLRSLDLSGFDGKLEDVHLGLGLAGALGGLKNNTSLRQLRIRHHDIGAAEDVTEICRLLAVNKGLKMLDCQCNNFNHHQFSKLVHALEFNHQIISFPISTADRDHALHEERRSLMQYPNGGKTGMPALMTSLGKSSDSRIDSALKWLGNHWDSEARKVAETLRRNRVEYANNPLLDLSLDLDYLDTWEDDDLMPWMAFLARNRDQHLAASRHSPDRLSMQSSAT